jgi:hypothetical protein
MSAHGQYPLTPSCDGFNNSSALPSTIGFQANAQNYLFRSPCLVDTFASGESSHGPQVAQFPATSFSQYYGQTVNPSIAPSLLGCVSTYSIANTAASFSASNGSHQNPNLDQASHYAPSEAYAYGLEFPSTMRPSTDRNSFGELGFGGAGMQPAFMTPYSGTMPESSEYYRPA